MRLHEEIIKQGILHSEKEIRSEAVLYFSRSNTHDDSIMPLAIQAVERHGWDEAFSVAECVTGLPLNDATLPWVLSQIQQKDAKKPNLYGWPARWHTLHSLLSNADAELLARHKDAIVAVGNIEAEVIEIVAQRVALLTANADACWLRLEQFCIDSKDAEDISDVNLDYAYALVEAIARHKDQYANKVLSILSETIEDLGSNPQVWMETFAVRMAGEMRLEAAIPLIVAKLKEGGEEAEWLREQSESALAKIGGDAAVQASADLFRQGDWHLRMPACNVLQHIHSDLAVSIALELLPSEEDSTVRAFLASGLASHLAFEAVEPLRQLVLDGTYDETYADLKHDLVIAATLMNVDFPERDNWAVEDRVKRLELENRRLEDQLQRSALEKKRFKQEVQRIQEAQYEFDDEEPPVQRVGRNDPCPCGSGKKFKRCCMRKQDATDLF